MQRQVEVRTYRDSRLEVLDDGGDGWTVAIYASDGTGRVLLRNRTPHGLAQLLKEAEAHVNRRLGNNTLPTYP